jgi:hypothetical protein
MEKEMYRIILVAGHLPADRAEDDRTSDQKFKSIARHRSHEVAGASEKVGPVCRFLLRGRRITERALSKRELVFGVPAPQDGKGGGWKGLVLWVWHDERPAEVCIDQGRTEAINATGWIDEFLRSVIAQCGWSVVGETTR